MPEEVAPAQLELLTSSGQQDELTNDLLLDQAGCAERLAFPDSSWWP